VAVSFARFELVEDVRVVHLDGCAIDEDLGDAIAAIAEHTGPTVLDLADVTLVGGHVDELVDELVDRCDAVGVVAPRRTARVILQRSGVADRCAVFGSLDDAIEALRPSSGGHDAGFTGAPAPT
jgi:hypothetical protein